MPVHTIDPTERILKPPGAGGGDGQCNVHTIDPTERILKRFAETTGAQRSLFTPSIRQSGY